MSRVYVNQDYFSKIASYVSSEHYCNAYHENNVKPDFTIRGNVNSIDMYLQNSIMQILQEKHYILVDFDKSQEIGALIKWQATFLGSPMYDNGHNYYYEVKAKPDSTHFVHTANAQPVHTDEGYTNKLPRYVSLYCASPADDGGQSILVVFHYLLDALHKKFGERVGKLLNTDALWIKNRLHSESKSLLLTLLDKSIGISYSPILQNLSCDDDVFEMFDFITHYVHDAKNQLRFTLQKKQLLIMDNCKVLHGRLGFNPVESRMLYRMWFSMLSLQQGNC